MNYDKEKNIMSQKTQVNNSGNIGFVGLLTLIFITLKLVGVIEWSWFWVLSPIIFTTGLFVLILFIVFLYAVFSK